MTKLGRNDQCPCGSGKKYKRCCLPQHEAAAADLAAAAAARAAARPASLEQARFGGDDDAGPDRLDELSNGALDMIRAGRLDEAERSCQSLLTEFPDMIDGHMRLGHLYRIRGDAKKAAEHLRQAAAMARTPDYDPEVALGLDAEADVLDPPSS